MHRRDVPSATDDGQFTEGSPAAGIPATSVSAAWLNDVQEELISILTAAGITPVKGDQDQVLQAIQALITAAAGGPKSLTQNGYRQIGDIIIQWGFGASTTGNQDNVIFPITFPNAVRSVILTEASSPGWGSPPAPTVYGNGSETQASFKVSAVRILPDGTSEYQTGLSFNWIAVGH